MTKSGILLLALALSVAMFVSANKKEKTYSDQVKNRLKEFFDEPDMSNAKKDFERLCSTYDDPEKAFNIVLQRGGFTYD